MQLKNELTLAFGIEDPKVDTHWLAHAPLQPYLIEMK